MFRLILSIFLPVMLMASGCERAGSGFKIPSPVREANGSLPNPFDPEDPVGPDDPDTPEEQDAERLARIGQTPIVEVYYTEYTDKSLFPSEAEMRYFTHVNVGHGRFVNKQTGDGGITIADEDLLRRMVAFKSGYPELKVKLMIGGWGKNADGFSMMARDAAKRKLFVDECVRICNEFGVDGFDIDWEYPTYAAKDNGYVNGASSEDYVNFITMLREMRAAMPDKIISYAASSSGKYTDNHAALEYADYINVMTYSMGNPPYHNSPLYASPLCRKLSIAETIDDVFHASQGIPYNRMNFGVGFYGHGDANNKAEGWYYPSSTDYSMLYDIFFKGVCKGKSVSGKNYRYWDDKAKVPFLGDMLGTMYASYEDIESINYKAEYILDRKMLGAMIWEYRHDDAKGTLRHALRHAMDGNPDPLGILERPDEYTPPAPVEAPVMGAYTRYKLDNVMELSGLCLSSDKSFLWGVGDQGTIYKISFQGVATEHWYHEADMEGVTLDPSTGDMYIAIEGSQKIYFLPAPDYNTYNTIWYVQDAVDGSYGNSGLEGITWYKDNKLFVGSQTGANLWTYGVDGTKLSKISLRTLAPDIKEVADLCYDPEKDLLWVVDSERFAIFLFRGDLSALVTTYDISAMTQNNPESICVDKANKCVWVADDAEKSVLWKVSFSGL